MDEQQKERRRQLGIPVHEKDSDHIFVDGYCTCGEADKTVKKPRKLRGAREGGSRAPSNLSIIEQCQDNR